MWFVYFLASVAALVIVCLCIPIELVFNANTVGRPKFHLRLIWLFGLFSRELPHAEEGSKKETISKPQGKSDNWLRRIKFALEILQTQGLFKQLGRFITRLIKCIHVKKLVANLKVDLDNPADTGLLFAVLAPLNLGITYFLPYHITFEPAFTGETVVAGYLNGAIKAMPIQIAASVIGVAFSLPSLRLAKRLIIFRWKRRRQ